MLKVMLVDDEQSVLIGLRYLIDWADQGCELCGVFQDPTAALAQAPQLQPDLVITDIEMPGISGLDLIASLRELLPGSIFAILSAYDDFSYAQQAVRLKAFRYLLKPLSVENLTELLEDVKRTLSAEPPGTEALSMFRSHMIQAVIQNGLDLRHSFTLPYYQKQFANRPLQLALVCQTGNRDPEAVFSHQLRHLFQPQHQFWADGFHILLLDASSDTLTKERFLALLDRPCICGLSAPFYGLTDSHTQYAQLVRSLEAEQFWCGRPEAAGTGTDARAAADQVCLAMQQAIWDQDTAVLDRSMDALLEALPGTVPRLSKHDAARLYARILTTAETLCQKVCTDHRTGQADLLRLSEQRTLEDMHQTVRTFLDSLLDEVRSHAAKQSSALVRKAKAYVNEHYAKSDFRLTDVSTALYVNYSYLSDLFRQETGETLSKYLLDIRMEQAKRLLTESELPVAEIGLRVGYPNTKTFYSAFKKYYNQAPKSYQKRFLR